MGGDKVKHPNRLYREQQTLAAMIRISCRKQHGGATMCEDCTILAEYAMQRAAQCRYGTQKPVCGKCTTHCYRKDMRALIRQVMKTAGPVMLFRHPLMTLGHLWDLFWYPTPKAL